MIQRAISREVSTLKSVHMPCIHMSAATERTSSGDGEVKSHDACTTRAKLFVKLTMVAYTERTWSVFACSKTWAFRDGSVKP